MCYLVLGSSHYPDTVLGSQAGTRGTQRNASLQKTWLAQMPPAGERVEISGQARAYMAGEIDLPDR